MRVLLINGSPRENGCTFTALKEVSATLENNGIETKILHIGTDAIPGCCGCGQCKGTGKCVLYDDIANVILKEMEGSDALIVGSPVYFASANGSLISVLDRVFYAGKNFRNKPAAAVVSARRAGTTASIDELNKYFSIRQMPIVSSTYWTMVHGSSPDDVRKDAEGLQTMRNLGQNMAWLLKCIECGRQNGITAPQAESGSTTNFIR